MMMIMIIIIIITIILLQIGSIKNRQLTHRDSYFHN